MPVFFLPESCIVPPHVSVTGDALTHVRDSLRVQVGDTLLVGDGLGRRHRISVTAISKRELIGRILESFTQPSRRTPSLLLGQALLKGDKMDWVIQKATELGVSAVLPVQTRHSVVQPKADRIGTQVARWQRIALEAAQQSEQWTVPVVSTPQPFANICTARPRTFGIILTERREGCGSFEQLALPATPDASVSILIGPEGGWTQEETAAAEKAGFIPVSLGPNILRAETAAVTAIAILQHRLGKLH